MITQLRRLTWTRGTLNHILVAAIVVLVLACGGLAGIIGLGPAVLAMGLILAAGLALFLARSTRRAPRHPTSEPGQTSS